MGGCQSTEPVISGTSPGERRDDGEKPVAPLHKSLSRKNRLRRRIVGLGSMVEKLRARGSLASKMVHLEVPFGKPIEESYDGVHTGKIIGGDSHSQSTGAIVRRVTHKATGVEFAVKCFDLNLIDTEEEMARLREEVLIMCQLDHPNIVQLEEVYETPSEIYLVQELCPGGDLLDHLLEQPDIHFTEAECAHMIKQMLSALCYLQSKGIVHRDLKLENFVLTNKKSLELKLIDFGLSKHFKAGEVQHESVGTPYTVAPEVIRGSYDEKCDMWGIGVIAYVLLCGDAPFGGCAGDDVPLSVVRSNILGGKYAFEPAYIWNRVSAPGKDFINNMLVMDPKVRPTPAQAQNHPWLAAQMRTRRARGLNPGVVQALVNFRACSRTRRLLREVLSFTLMANQIRGLRDQFDLLDTEGAGEISLGAMKQYLVTDASAGSISESDVEEIFDVMRVDRASTRIQWHEFLAAELSRCRLDGRNLRLAFDRLDGNHKGYLSPEDMADLLGGGDDSPVETDKVWGDCVKDLNRRSSPQIITYHDFAEVLKGEVQEAAP